jgi:hypothetical protein
VQQPEKALELQRLWDEVRHRPFPAAETDEPALQELALYVTWLGSIVEAALARGGRLSPAHRRLLEVREAEGNQALFKAGADLGDAGRAYLARLLAVEELLRALPAEA